MWTRVLAKPNELLMKMKIPFHPLLVKVISSKKRRKRKADEEKSSRVVEEILEVDEDDDDAPPSQSKPLFLASSWRNIYLWLENL